MKIKGNSLIGYFSFGLQRHVQTTYKNREYSLANDNDVYLLIEMIATIQMGSFFIKDGCEGRRRSKKRYLKGYFRF